MEGRGRGRGGEEKDLAYGKLSLDGLQLGWVQDAGVAEVFEFCADGVEGAVYLGGVGHCFGWLMAGSRISVWLIGEFKWSVGNKLGFRLRERCSWNGWDAVSWIEE